MIKYLHRLKGKKGFTLVELVVVIGLIVILSAIILVNLIGGNTDKQLSANSNAKSFFTAVQLTMTRAQLTERELVNYGNDDIAYIAYFNGANHISNKKKSLATSESDNYLFIEAKYSQTGMVGLHVSDTLTGLMELPDPTSSMSDLESYLAQNIDAYMADSYDGYFYAAIDNDFKVVFTHFCDLRFPTYTDGDDKEDYRFKELGIGSGGKLLGNNRVLGTCADDYALASQGMIAFNIPSATDNAALFEKYLGN